MGWGIPQTVRGQSRSNNHGSGSPPRPSRGRRPIFLPVDYSQDRTLTPKLAASLVSIVVLSGCASAPMLECTTPRVAYPQAAKAQGAHGIVKVRIGVSEV